MEKLTLAVEIVPGIKNLTSSSLQRVCKWLLRVKVLLKKLLGDNIHGRIPEIIIFEDLDLYRWISLQYLSSLSSDQVLQTLVVSARRTKNHQKPQWRPCPGQLLCCQLHLQDKDNYT